MTKHTDEFLQSAAPVTCLEYTLPRDEKSTDPKGGIRVNTKIGPVLEVTTSYLQNKCGVEIWIWICKQRQFSLVGQNFSWTEQVGHGLEQQRRRRQRAGDLWHEVGSICVEDGKADQKLKQNRQDLPLLAHLQELYLFVKEYGLILNHKLNPIKRTQRQKDETLFFGMDNYHAPQNKYSYKSEIKSKTIGL